MKISIDYCNETDLLDKTLDCEALAAQTAARVLEMEKFPWDVRINLVVTDEASIHEINRQYRRIDRPTDVLSFPMVDFPGPGDYSVSEEDAMFDLDTGELLLGDIMICAEKVLAQAEEYGHSPKREFCFLIAHSTLHLLGYDHMQAEEAAVMEAKQEAALDALGITRQDDHDTHGQENQNG